jgi:hypothetical protein
MRITHFVGGLASLAILSVAAPAPGREINVPGGAELGRVKVCDGLRQQGTCKDMHANMACTELESPVKYNLNSIVQDKGNMCAYHQGGGCDKLAFIVDSSDSTQTADVSPKWAPVLTHVLCVPGHAGMDSASASAALGASMDNSIPILKSSTLQPEMVARQNPNAALGDALICSPDIHPGPCFKVPASGTCTDLPANIDRKVRHIYQNRGSYCEYFKTDDCHGRLGWSDSTKESKRVTVPDDFGDRMGSAYCIRSPLAAQGAGVEGEAEGWSLGEFVAEAGGV